MGKDDVIVFVSIVIILLLSFALIYFGANSTCGAKANALGYKHNFKIFQGCLLIKPDGQKVLLEQLRDFNN